VHILKFDRFIDTPLSTSSAKPWVGGSHSRMDDDAKYQPRESGQELLVLMIPHLLVQEAAPDSKETKVNISGEAMPFKHILLMILPLLVVPLLTVASTYVVQNGQSVTTMVQLTERELEQEDEMKIFEVEFDTEYELEYEYVEGYFEDEEYQDVDDISDIKTFVHD
jgi:hypothetical protein